MLGVQALCSNNPVLVTFISSSVSSEEDAQKCWLIWMEKMTLPPDGGWVVMPLLLGYLSDDQQQTPGQVIGNAHSSLFRPPARTIPDMRRACQGFQNCLGTLFPESPSLWGGGYRWPKLSFPSLGTPGQSLVPAGFAGCCQEMLVSMSGLDGSGPPSDWVSGLSTPAPTGTRVKSTER